VQGLNLAIVRPGRRQVDKGTMTEDQEQILKSKWQKEIKKSVSLLHIKLKYKRLKTYGGFLYRLKVERFICDWTWLS
jgi:hypothetical protein